MWPAQFGQKLVLGTRRKWPRPRRDGDVCLPRSRRWQFFSRRDRDETLVRLETVSRPRPQPCVTFRCVLTVDSILHIAMVRGHASLVEIRGLTQIKHLQSAHLFDPTRFMHGGVGTAVLRCWPPTKLTPTAAVIVGLNREDVEWAKYRSNNEGLWHGAEAVVL